MVTLHPMSEATFSAYRAWSVRDYAQDLVKSGMALEADALGKAEAEFAELLPGGLESERNYLYAVHGEAGDEVGWLWYQREADDPGCGFICDFLIHEPHRRHGYGRQAMEALEDDARQKGVDKLVLSVFRFNEAARRLYENLGYLVMEEHEGNLLMSKTLNGGACMNTELNRIIEKFAECGWDVIDGPSKAWLQDGSAENRVALVAAVEAADRECGSCGCEFDPLYKRALALLAGA